MRQRTTRPFWEDSGISAWFHRMPHKTSPMLPVFYVKSSNLKMLIMNSKFFSTTKQAWKHISMVYQFIITYTFCSSNSPYTFHPLAFAPVVPLCLWHSALLYSFIKVRFKCQFFQLISVITPVPLHNSSHVYLCIVPWPPMCRGCGLHTACVHP